jgi:PAS domain-containing protein
MQRELSRLLREWREAEQRWEVAAGSGDGDGARREVLRAWLAYNAAAGSFTPDEIVLLADDRLNVVSAYGPTASVLRYEPDALVGRSILELTPPEAEGEATATWQTLLRVGQLEGRYPLRRADGTLVMTRLVARAHHPLPGLHASRHRALEEPG